MLLHVHGLIKKTCNVVIKKNWFDLFENKRNYSEDGNLRFYLAQILFAINFDEEEHHMEGLASYLVLEMVSVASLPVKVVAVEKLVDLEHQ